FVIAAARKNLFVTVRVVERRHDKSFQVMRRVLALGLQAPVEQNRHGKGRQGAEEQDRRQRVGAAEGGAALPGHGNTSRKAKEPGEIARLLSLLPVVAQDVVAGGRDGGLPRIVGDLLRVDRPDTAIAETDEYRVRQTARPGPAAHPVATDIR